MSKYLLIILIIFCLQSLAYNQLLPNRYVEEIFANYTESQPVLFSTGVPQPKPGGTLLEFISGLPIEVDETDIENVDLYMKIFEPEGDVLNKRAAIVICFGGGFVDGSKDHWSMRLLAAAFAKRGFVVALIDYRLGMNAFDMDLATRSVYRGIQDGRSAIRFFRADAAGANTYKIDPDKIFIGGHSSGGFIALHNVYMDDDERPVSTGLWMQGTDPIPDLGCLDCAGNNQGFSGKANGVFNLAGALGFLEYMKSANEILPILFHSEDDETVPYHSGEPLTNYGINFDLPTVYGSFPISVHASELGIPYQFNSYTDRGHGVHEDESNGMYLYPEIVPDISNWFYIQHLQPEAPHISGNYCISETQLNQIYTASNTVATYFDWSVEGGTIVNLESLSNQVEVNWDNQSSNHSLSLTTYSCNGARGIPQTVKIFIPPISQNIASIPFAVTDSSYFAVQNITSTATIINAQNIQFHTGGDIYLEPGFEVQNLGSFTAATDTCLHP